MIALKKRGVFTNLKTVVMHEEDDEEEAHTKVRFALDEKARKQAEDEARVEKL